ncbi:MAG: TonB-dependent receptor [Pontixanthobacter sp.]
MRLQFVASGSRLALAVGFLAVASAPALAQDNGQQDPGEQSPQVSGNAQANEIVISGIRQSIEGAIDDKRNASEIKDSITAEDIGQLANDNIAEALQRITGVQVDRSNDGEGKQVQIRGLSDNNVTINGATASGTGDVDLSNGNDRGVNFQDLPAELFAGVEILKSLSADQIEGSLGGTINLQTRAPLKGKRKFILNLSGTEKYSEVGELSRQDANLFVQKQFLDTPLGDFGLIFNVGYKEIASIANVYGGGEFDDAQGIWLRKTGDADPPPSQGNNQGAGNYNYFQLANVPNLVGGGSLPNPYNYAFDDVNGDGLSDANDVYYIPGQFGVSSRFRDDVRKSFNGTLQWKPASNVDIRLDAVLTDLDQSLTGANLNLVSNVVRAGYLEGGPGNVFAPLANTPEFGETYVMTAGRLGSFTTRTGAAPSINEIQRKSQQYSLEGTWEATPNLTLYAKGITSEGKATTLNFGQLQAGIEHQGGDSARSNSQDFYNIVDFNAGTNLIPNVTLYESPFPSPNWPVKSVVAEDSLVVLDPGDLSYERYRYRQYQRNAADTKNTDDSFRLDATWETDGGFFEAFKGGFRWAKRRFQRAQYVNANEGGNANLVPYTQWDGLRDPTRGVVIQQIPLDPNNTTDPGAAATAEFLSQCFAKATTSGELSRFGGNLPDTWDATAGCDITSVQDYFNMLDIRAIDPVSGSGVYEVRDARFDVGDETLAGYLRADIKTTIGKVGLFGNVGLRYVKTKTGSTGYIQNQGTPTTYSLVTFNGEYDDWLPSANLNLALSDDIIARAAYSRTLGRPSLRQISPGLDINRVDNDPVYAGFGLAGNPFLKPVHSDNFDVSLEWYYGKGSYVSLAGFIKKIDSTIFRNPVPTDREIDGELFSVTTYENFGGTDIKGIEFGMAHAFTYLPGILSNLGVTGNFTIIDESSDLKDQEGDPISRRGLSDFTYNVSGYYDDGGLSLRLAYNWRSEYTKREVVSLGFNRPETLPEIEAARGQLDFAARYRVNKNVRLTFNAVNITDTGTYRYLKYPVLVNYLSVAGPKYDFGIAVSF